MRVRSIVSTPLLAGALATLLVACGSGTEGSSGDDGSTTPAGGADLVMTAVDGIKWREEAVSIGAGQVVVQLDNRSSLQHNLYFIGADGTEHPSHLDSTGPGDDPTETVDLAEGTYTIICKIPGHTSMKATLTVEPAGG
jgi:plastocyanin